MIGWNLLSRHPRSLPDGLARTKALPSNLRGICSARECVAIDSWKSQVAGLRMDQSVQQPAAGHSARSDAGADRDIHKVVQP